MPSIRSTLSRDFERYEGVRPIQILAMRLGYLLVFVTVGTIAWPRLLQHEGPWDPIAAAALAMWAGSSFLSVFGLIHPLRWIPLFLFEIAYKSIWLLVVAYPLWRANQLSGSAAEEMTGMFLPVIIGYVVMPWGYVLRTYVLPRRQGGAAVRR